jgi:hypothetical protein
MSHYIRKRYFFRHTVKYLTQCVVISWEISERRIIEHYIRKNARVCICMYVCMYECAIQEQGNRYDLKSSVNTRIVLCIISNWAWLFVRYMFTCCDIFASCLTAAVVSYTILNVVSKYFWLVHCLWIPLKINAFFHISGEIACFISKIKKKNQWTEAGWTGWPGTWWHSIHSH